MENKSRNSFGKSRKCDATKKQTQEQSHEKIDNCKIIMQETVKKNSYYYAVGRRKTSVAQVKLFSGTGSIVVNGKDINVYFPNIILQDTVHSALRAVGQEGVFDINVSVNGGGITGQAESIRLGISRALEKKNAEVRKPLKALGYLRRDPRKKERKKYGLKKARRAPQWSKR